MTDQSLGDPAPVALGYFANDRHALMTGMVVGMLMKAGITVRPETDGEGNYLPELVVEVPPLEELHPPIEVHVRVLPGQDGL